MSQRRRALGQAGEDAAARHLETQGYRVLARNVRAGGVELDLVVERRGTLAFVEVKARSSRRFGSAAEAVDARKRARLVRGALAWLHDTHKRSRALRFDVVTWERDESGRYRLEHWQDAFRAGE